MTNTYKTEAIVIKRRNWKEADKILTVFTKEYGKISVLAKGVRKLSSRRAPVVELFNHTELMLHQASFLDIVTEAAIHNSFETIKKDLVRISRAYEACELVEYLTGEDQENEDVFYLLLSYLEQINTHEPASTAQFKRQILSALGYLSEKDSIEQEIDAFIESIAERRLTAPRIYE
ncbi:MAG: DNA repair protein RecO [Candidatus Lloydbacteria bacterium RIFCSPHIGHO2_01_FULL_49_22]|uniref:DNA repair protein RecO n=1 Tax=Candidatus Lloydbacteria bacterium RIFCSPHIGHO2_01_FULL_49_22 TaxID=1798658 RepID=A0A1G2CXD8_9BACT|nr:MAG: DNA repair protein RecO [Candidatus Lloydbacteria bacterium RIFCSPHIGHO2_01_FULL_49_22]